MCVDDPPTPAHLVGYTPFWIWSLVKVKSLLNCHWFLVLLFIIPIYYCCVLFVITYVSLYVWPAICCCTLSQGRVVSPNPCPSVDPTMAMQTRRPRRRCGERTNGGRSSLLTSSPGGGLAASRWTSAPHFSLWSAWIFTPSACVRSIRRRGCHMESIIIYADPRRWCIVGVLEDTRSYSPGKPRNLQVTCPLPQSPLGSL